MKYYSAVVTLLHLPCHLFAAVDSLLVYDGQQTQIGVIARANHLLKDNKERKRLRLHKTRPAAEGARKVDKDAITKSEISEKA